jgi:murein DD-endopeptidase MepM/ murein hydrolase activator NlpD
MERYFHFLYVRGGNAGVRTIRVHRALAIVSFIAFVSITACSIVLLATRSGQIAHRLVIENLTRENKRLTRELASFQREAEGLRQKMDLSFELQNRARLIASLEPISNDIWQVGIGGPEASLGALETAYPDGLFNNIDESLDQMVRQSDLQLESYNEILAVLGKEQEVRKSTPSVRPLRGGFLSSRFGRRMDPFRGEVIQHPGVDYRARSGTPVVGTADGIVSMAGRNGGFGLMIEINHGNGFKTRYAHLSRVLVHRGQKVKRSEIIGLVGNTGHSTGSHLHYEVLFRKVHRDPLQYVMPDGLCFD